MAFAVQDRKGTGSSAAAIDADSSSDSDTGEDEPDMKSDEKTAKWFVLDPKRGKAKVENLLQEPVISAIVRQTEFEYTWYGHDCLLFPRTNLKHSL